MPINISVPSDQFELKPRITVIGTGGAGGNAVNNMIRSNLEGVEFVIANTDAQALTQSLCTSRIQLGVNITRGLGAGSRPEIGRAAAEEAMEEIMEYLHGSNMVFVTAGMGGGTGTGAAPVIARAAREVGILTVGVVTKPFHFEGAHRMRLAEAGLEELQQVVDTLIIIPNQNLFRIANEKTTFADAFKLADNVLHSGVRGITDLMVMPGLINLDFADIRTVMMEMGKAMMGTGEAEGDNRAIAAAEAAISNPLLDDVSMKGAKGVLINITGGYDMTLFEIDEAANRIREEVDADANIIFGSTFDESLNGRMRLSIVATGIDSEHIQRIPAGTRAIETSGGLPQGSQHGFGFAAPRRPGSTGAFGATARPGTAKPAFGFGQAPAKTNETPGEPSAAMAAPAPAAAGPVPAPATAAPEATAPAPAPAAPGSNLFTAPKVSSGLSVADLPASPAPVAPPVRPVSAFIAPEPVKPVTREEPPVITPPAHLAGSASDRNVNNPAAAGRPSFFERLTGAPVRPQGEEAPPAPPAANRTDSTTPQEDSLDIPAFLRRK